MSTTAFSPELTADFLHDLWKRSELIDALPAELAPASVENAFAVQSAYLARHVSCGWKVGPGPVELGGWAAAPLRGVCHQSPAQWGGVLPGIEIEIAFVLGADLPADSTAVQAKAAIETCNLGVEIFRARYVNSGALPFPQVIADHLNNAGVLLGSGKAVADIPDMANLPISLEADGVAIGQSIGGPSFDDLMVPLCWLADYATARGRALRAGDVIITGARIGTLPIEKGKSYRAVSALGIAEFTTV
jgi:2-keto-4-pentenoate hydratase